MSYSRLLLSLTILSLLIAGCAAMQSIFGTPAGSDTSAAQDGAKAAFTFLGLEAGNLALTASNLGTAAFAWNERRKRLKTEAAATLPPLAS